MDDRSLAKTTAYLFLGLKLANIIGKTTISELIFNPLYNLSEKKNELINK